MNQEQMEKTTNQLVGIALMLLAMNGGDVAAAKRAVTEGETGQMLRDSVPIDADPEVMPMLVLSCHLAIDAAVKAIHNARANLN